MPNCGNPYLYWHHFDPPWNEREHHNPSGMIALCAEHHAKADNGAFTKEQLREFKNVGAEQQRTIKGKFDWMRHQLLAVVGGNFYYETYTIFEYKGERIIWFNRDKDSYSLLNVKMLTVSNEPRIKIIDNDWLSSDMPEDIICPPSGKLLDVKYPNGDMLKIEFKELESETEAKKRYPNAAIEQWKISFPLTAVEVHNKIAGTEICFGPRETTLPGANIVRNSFMTNCHVGLRIT